MKNKGFTLIEVLITSLLVFIVISIAVMSFMAGSSNFIKAEETTNASWNCKTVLEAVSTELREAIPTQPVTITSSPSVKSITFTKFHNPSNNLQNVTWKFENGKVTRESGGQSIVLNNNISNLNFEFGPGSTSANPKVIKVTVVSESKKKFINNQPVSRIELCSSIFLRQNQSYSASVIFQVNADTVNQPGTGGSQGTSNALITEDQPMVNSNYSGSIGEVICGSNEPACQDDDKIPGNNDLHNGGSYGSN